MNLEKCPKCKHWALSFDPIDGTITCHKCSYHKAVDVDIYSEKLDMMPKLSKSLELNGYKK